MIGVEKEEIYALELLIVGLKFVHRPLNFGRVSAILHVDDIFGNCNWVVTRWQKYNTYLHTKNT